jgi:hypothetical protein
MNVESLRGEASFSWDSIWSRHLQAALWIANPLSYHLFSYDASSAQPAHKENQNEE